MIGALASRALAAHWRLQRACLAIDSALIRRRLVYRRARCCGLGRLVSFLCAGDTNLPVPVLAEPKPSEPIGIGDARESTPLRTSHEAGLDSRGGQKIYIVEALGLGRYYNSPPAWSLVGTIAAKDVLAAYRVAQERYACRGAFRVIPLEPSR